MKVLAKKGDINTSKSDAIVLGWYSDDKVATGGAELVNKKLGGLLNTLAKAEEFDGKVGDALIVRTSGMIPASKVILVGLGKKKELTYEKIRNTVAVVVNQAKVHKIKSLTAELLGGDCEKLDSEELSRAMTTGALLANYQFTTYKSKKKKGTTLKNLEIYSDDKKVSSGVKLGTLMSEANMLARDLVNTPGQDMHPESMVKVAKKIAQESPNVTIKVYNQTDLKKMGAGCILGVAQGSIYPAFLVHLTYKPSGAAKKKIALVGKSVTFDTGGLSLKPAKHMESMKVDMGGGAAVLGAFSVISKLKPKMEVHGIIAPVENMLSGTAIRPGDVLTAINKKTVEVLNTDAEGRLALADSLCYAVKLKPDYIINLATLTGACVVALGEEITGLMGNNDELIKMVKTASNNVGEKTWHMPLEKSYKKLLKSNVADLKNIGGGYGGALTAGLFLEEFVDKTPWVHLDIAGPAYAERPINAYTKKGATGHGTRILLELLKNN